MNRRLIKPFIYMKAEEGDLGDGVGDGEGDAGDMGDTAGGGGGGGDGASWADTWREEYAGDDEGKLAKLSRYASPHAAFDAMIAAQTKISSGEFKSTAPFPEEGSEEEKNAWREANGIPLSADKYDLDLGDGLVIGEDDKPIIDDFIEHAHKSNMAPADVSRAVEWYFHNQEKIQEARQEADLEAKTVTEDALRAEWGDEYRANINRISGLLDTAPEGVKDNILNARSGDGTPLLSTPGVNEFLIDLALQVNPATTLVPGAGDNLKGAVSDEIKEIEAMMGNKNSEYWKGPKANDMQSRYRQLLEAQQKIK